jgi:hypothetical protein
MWLLKILKSLKRILNIIMSKKISQLSTAAKPLSGQETVVMNQNGGTVTAILSDIKTYTNSDIDEGGGEWGTITGTLNDQSDLKYRLDSKASLSTLNTFVASNQFNGTTSFAGAVYADDISAGDIATSGDVVAGQKLKGLSAFMERSVITNYISAVNYRGASPTNWDSSYTTVRSNSATWGGGSDDSQASTKVRGSSANWDSNYTTVNSNSGNWNSNYTTVRANSGNWDSTKTTVWANSGTWTNGNLITLAYPPINDWPVSILYAGGPYSSTLLIADAYVWSTDGSVTPAGSGEWNQILYNTDKWIFESYVNGVLDFTDSDTTPVAQTYHPTTPIWGSATVTLLSATAFTTGILGQVAIYEDPNTFNDVYNAFMCVRTSPVRWLQIT